MEDVELLKLLNECAHYLHYKKPAYRGRSKALHHLIDEGALSQRKLMERMDIKAGSMSELLHKMEADGLIERKRDTNDKRNVLVNITEYGKQQLSCYDDERKQRAEDTFEVLSSGEKDELADMLSRMLADWKKKWTVETTHDEQHRMLDHRGV